MGSERQHTGNQRDHIADGEFFRIKQPQVIHQTIDGEVVVIHLDTGSYYSLNGTAAVIWSALANGATAEQITTFCQQRYLPGGIETQASVTEFLKQLQAEALIVHANHTGQKTEIEATALAPVETFVKPELQKFTDMQELLLLDPIHEVEPTGWPLARPAIPPKEHGGK